MSWDSTESARRYDQWARTSQGAFALRQEEHLLQGLIAPWPRRKQKLLDIGCGAGLFLDFFWSCGFDLTGLDQNPDLLARARDKMGGRVDLHLGRADHLPFDDREFDYASIMTVLEFMDDPGAVLREAARVARKGILITFLNRSSLHGWSARLSSKTSFPAPARWFTWTGMRQLLQKNIPAGFIQARSILLGPAATWKPIPLIWRLNSLPLFPSLGALTAVRVDMTPPRAQTPLMAWNTEPTM